MKTFYKCCIGLLATLSVNITAGPGYPACLLACELACCGTAIIPVALPAYLLCAQACPGLCLASCFSSETKIIVANKDGTFEIDIQNIKVGDKVLTLENGRPKWTTVLKNVKTDGQTNFIQIDAQANTNSSKTRTLTVTPEHGLLILNQAGEKVITPAKNALLGDKIIDQDGEELSIVNLSKLEKDEKFTLETSEGTILASGVLVTTLCHEEVLETKQDFNRKIADWQARHNFTTASKN